MIAKKEEISNIKVSINSINYLEAPVEENTKIGEIKVENGKENICNIDIITRNRIEKKNTIYYFIELIGKLGYIEQSNFSCPLFLPT